MSFYAGLAKGLLGVLGVAGLVQGCQHDIDNVGTTIDPATCHETIHEPTTIVDGKAFELQTLPDGTQTIHIETVCGP